MPPRSSDETAKLRAEFYHLKEQEMKLDDLLQKNKGALVQRLPNEILVAIFEHATTFHCTTCVDPCWKWLGVCRRWRNVIKHTPSLWTYLSITPRWTRTMVQRHLANSRDMPLTITIRPLSMRERWFGITGARRHLLSLIAPLAGHAARWRSLDIRGFPPSTLQFMLDQFDCVSYSRVERIHIQSDKYESGAVPWPNWITPDVCPRLTHLHLSAFHIPDVVPSFNLASLALITDNTQWTPSSPSLPFALQDVLVSSSKLATLTLYGTGRSFRDLSLVPDSIHIPTLHTLNLFPRDVDMPGLENVVMAIVAPELRHLQYVPRWPTETLTPDMFHGAENPRFPRVTHFRIKNAVNGRHDMTSFVSAFPMVRHAALGGAEITTFMAQNGSGHRPVDGWRHLESMAVIEPEMSIMDDLLQWLAERNRHCKEKKMLRMSLEDVANSSEFSEYHERLMRHAIVEFKDVRIKIGKATFPISPSFRAELSRYTPGMVSAIGSVLSSEYTLCEPDDETASFF
ncbi:hypothetical protein J3A83DRAFT_38182 [Scleroderma citrinum]